MTRDGLWVHYATRAELEAAGAGSGAGSGASAGAAASGFADVLGIARLADAAAPGRLPLKVGASLGSDDIPLVQVAARPLGAEHELYEVWRSASRVSRGRSGPVRYAADGRILFGALSVEHDGGSLGTSTEAAYIEIFRSLEASHYPHLLRTWNYFPGINREAEGVERYRQFNSARQRAFRSARREIRGNVPAACALGTHGGDALVIYFLAGIEAGLAIENPRQVPGYDYPREYGESSPTFARAAMVAAPEPILFVSGTASIRGSRSMFPGDVRAQTRETVANLRTLVEAANRVAGRAQFAAETLRYKVYLRRAEDATAVAGEIAAGLDTRFPLLYLEADICRAELLVEIEALGLGHAAR
jgi:enamine deaminase RidA (YjgF/YER057c/UK114 family)